VTIGQIGRADLAEADLLRFGFGFGSIAAAADIKTYFV
jgi:hypothetical protein